LRKTLADLHGRAWILSVRKRLGRREEPKRREVPALPAQPKTTRPARSEGGAAGAGVHAPVAGICHVKRRRAATTRYLPAAVVWLGGVEPLRVRATSLPWRGGMTSTRTERKDTVLAAFQVIGQRVLVANIVSYLFADNERLLLFRKESDATRTRLL
jgi:hypothetical protein